MTVQSRAAKKSRRAQQNEPTADGTADAACDDASNTSIETWVLGLQLRALHLEHFYRTDTASGQYAFGVAVACRQAIRERYVMTSDHLAEELTTREAQSGFDDTTALIKSTLACGVSPSGRYDDLLPGLVNRDPVT
jgi:hypothetical protein